MDKDTIRDAAEEAVHFHGNYSEVVNHIKSVIRAAVEREQNIILAQIGGMYPDEMDTSTNETIRNIESIIRIRQGGK